MLNPAQSDVTDQRKLAGGSRAGSVDLDNLSAYGMSLQQLQPKSMLLRVNQFAAEKSAGWGKKGPALSTPKLRIRQPY